MELLDIVRSACGKDENSAPNSTITLNTYQGTDLKNQKLKPLISHTAFNPIVSIRSLGNFVMVDLTFRAPADNDLRILWTILEKYGESQEVTAQSIATNVCDLLIVPNQFDGQYYINAVSPVFWALQSEKPNHPLTVIRLLFLSELFSVYETDEVDATAIEAEVERELDENERKELIAEEKEAERNAILDKREAEFNKQRFSK